MGQFNKTSKDKSSTVSILKELEKYLISWKWFAFSIVLCVLVSFVYYKTKVNIYETKALVLIKEDGGATTDLKAFQDLSSLGLGLGQGSNILDEIEILNSRTLFSTCIKKLNLNYELYLDQGLKKKEIYTNRPFNIQVLSNKNDFIKFDTIVDVKIIDSKHINFSIEKSDKVSTVSFGEKINIGKYSFLLIPENIDFKKQEGENYVLIFRNISNTSERYKDILDIEPVDNHSNIISFTLRHPIKKKAKNILNTMIDVYNQMSIDDQNQVCQKTDEFITKRLEVVKNELDEIDKYEELYKSDKKITDLELQSQVFVGAQSNNENEIMKKQTELRLVNFMIEEINKDRKEFDLLPSSIGISDSPQLAGSVNDYNQLLSERNRLVSTSALSNPIIKNLDLELKSFLVNIRESLFGIKKQLEISLSSLSSVEEKYDNKISSLPKQVREYRGILRRQAIIAELYSYLLQKKEENEISMAVTVSNSKLIDKAFSLNKSIAPNKKLFVLGGLMIGIMIPLSIIFIKDLFDNKFKTRSELEEAITAPILGDIPFDTSGEKIVVTKGSRTSTAEAFRLLRTNLDFMLSSVDTSTKTIFVTSTISGEGKTFVAANVAASIALTGKKVLLTGLDLRAPKISQYLGLPNRKGVSNYLVDKNLLLEDLVSPLDGFDNLDFLSSGVVPPNPAELLLSSRMKDMFSELNEIYDYIVVDTAPVNLVTDTLMISQYADLFVYTVRSNYLDSNLLEVPERMYVEKRLPNMAVLLNGLDYTRGYGYGGYGYPKEDTHKNIFQRLFKK